MIVSAIFYQIFIFLPNDSPLKIMKNVFILSGVFFSGDIQIFVIFSLSTLSRVKRASGSGLIYDAMNWLL